MNMYYLTMSSFSWIADAVDLVSVYADDTVGQTSERMQLPRPIIIKIADLKNITGWWADHKAFIFLWIFVVDLYIYTLSSCFLFFFLLYVEPVLQGRPSEFNNEMCF